MTNIKNIYNDALYWVTSPQSKDKEYHISRVHESILRKLIHYTKKKDTVYYTNNVIAKHIYLGEEQVKKSIPNLEKKGYIKCVHFTNRDDNYKIIKRRGISINWNTFEKIMIDLPNAKNNVVVVESDDEDTYISEVNIVNNQTESSLDDEKQTLKYRQDDMVNLLDFFDSFGFEDDLKYEFIFQFKDNINYTYNVEFKEILKYARKIINDQIYNDYKGVRIEKELMTKFNQFIIQ